MTENAIKATLVLGSSFLVLLYLFLERPGYLANSSSLAFLIGAEIVLVAIAKFTRLYFPLVILIFLASGINMPGQMAFTQARWSVLGIGAVAGVAIYMKSRDHSFGVFHLVAFFCILSAAVSASVSAYQSEAQLKALSLALLFVYAGFGARLVASGPRAATFFRGVLTSCEILTWFSVISYFLLRWEVYGNPNSLGAITGVVLVPMLLWGMLGCPSGIQRTRLALELALSVLLLMSSFSRDGIGAALLASFIICLALRRYRLMIKGMAAIILLAICAVSILPRSTQLRDISESQGVEEAYLYKGKVEGGVLGSRRGVWNETWDSIKQNPWFGTGFGTSKVYQDKAGLIQYALHHADSWVMREHGNSYLAIAEWTGLLGVIPFYGLIVFTSINALKVFTWLRRTSDISCPAVPAAAIVTAGLVHAMFEDWMFAVGYYLCVFFWVITFVLMDLLPWCPVVLEPQPSGPEPIYQVSPISI